MAVYHGTAGDDELHGTGGNDRFDLTDGGNDLARGGAGVDIFDMGASLTADDSIDGGGNGDSVTLDGDYADLVLSDTTFVNIEGLYLQHGHDYGISIDNAAVADKHSGIIIHAYNLKASDRLMIDASRIDHGLVFFEAGAGDDVLIGSQLENYFFLQRGGEDQALGTAGRDAFSLGASLDADDTIMGGDGFDTMDLNGAYAEPILLDGVSVQGIEEITLSGKQLYHVLVRDGMMGTGETLTIATVGAVLDLDGSDEHDGELAAFGGKGADHLIGGEGQDWLAGDKKGDTIQGGGGADDLSGGAGRDWFVFAKASDSTVSAPDQIHDFGRSDILDLRSIDANMMKSGDQAFHLVDAFTGHAGELVVRYDAGTTLTDISGDVDGDGSTDLFVQIAYELTDFAAIRL